MKLIHCVLLALIVAINAFGQDPAPGTVATDIPEVEYQARLARIGQFVEAGNFEALLREGDEIQDIWGGNGGERFARLILEITNAGGYSIICDAHPEARNLLEKYAVAALERSDSYGFESEAFLVMKLRYLPNRTHLWLHLLSRLEREKDLSADPYFVPPYRQVDAPEDPRWNRDVDEAAKAKFERERKAYIEELKWLRDQYRLRNIAAELAEPLGTKFLAHVYSRPPFSHDDLESLLDGYTIADSLKKKILKARDEMVPKQEP